MVYGQEELISTVLSHYMCGSTCHCSPVYPNTPSWHSARCILIHPHGTQPSVCKYFSICLFHRLWKDRKLTLPFLHCVRCLVQSTMHSQ